MWVSVKDYLRSLYLLLSVAVNLKLFEKMKSNKITFNIVKQSFSIYKNKSTVLTVNIINSCITCG